MQNPKTNLCEGCKDSKTFSQGWCGYCYNDKHYRDIIKQVLEKQTKEQDIRWLLGQILKTDCRLEPRKTFKMLGAMYEKSKKNK